MITNKDIYKSIFSNYLTKFIDLCSHAQNLIFTIFLTQRDEEENNLLDQKSLEIQKKKIRLTKAIEG